MPAARSRLRRPLVAAAAMMVAVTGVLPFARVVAAGNCTDAQKPAVFPVDQLRKGMHATGYTVVEGRQQEPFDVEILGVDPDGIAPGVDFILVQVSGPVIDRTGGIAFGFSGSPVYVGDRLVGSVSYGFYLADHTIGGLTPAEAMVPLFDYPSGSPEAGRAEAAQRVRRVSLSPALRRAGAGAVGSSTAAFPSSARQLLLPVAVSGLNDRALDQFQRVVDALKLPVFAYRGGVADTPAATSPTPLQDGDSVASMVSYGDLTVGGIGTLTATCGNVSLAFGHPFFFDGSTTMGMNGADILATITDPSGIEGPFKYGVVAEPHGVIDQDRLTGIRGIEGTLPSFAPVTVDVTNPDLGRSQSGETDVVKQEISGSSLFPELAAFALLREQDVAFDRIGDGTDSVAWILRGTTESGEEWSLTRQNMFFSSYDASFFGIFELLNDLYTIAGNEFEPVTFTNLHVDANITQRQLTTKIQRVLVWSRAERTYVERKRISVQPGGRIRLRVELLPRGSTTPDVVNVAVPVPERLRGGGELVVRGGGNDSGFFFEGGGDSSGAAPSSFGELLSQLATADHGNDLVVQLALPGVDQDQGRVVRPQSRVVLGSKSITVLVGSGGSVGGGKVGGGCTARSC